MNTTNRLNFFILIVICIVATGSVFGYLWFVNASNTPALEPGEWVKELHSLRAEDKSSLFDPDSSKLNISANERIVLLYGFHTPTKDGRPELPVGSACALSADNGGLVWTSSNLRRPLGRMIMTQDSAYTISYPGKLSKINSLDGRVDETYHDDNLVWLGPLSLDRSNVYGGGEIWNANQSRQVVTATTLDTLKPVWMVTLTAPSSLIPDVERDVLYVLEKGKALKVLNKRTGRVVHSMPLPGEFRSLRTAGSRRLVVVGSSRIACIDTSSWTVVWRLDNRFECSPGAIATSGRRLFCIAGEDRRIQAIDLDTGRMLWEKPVRDDLEIFLSTTDSAWLVYATRPHVYNSDHNDSRGFDPRPLSIHFAQADDGNVDKVRIIREPTPPLKGFNVWVGGSVYVATKQTIMKIVPPTR